MGARAFVRVTGWGQQAERAREVLAQSGLLDRSQINPDDAASTVQPDVVLVVPDAPAALLNDLKTARTSAPGATLVAMAAISGPDSLVSMVAAGADGLILPDAPPSTIIATLEGVARGENGFSRDDTSTIVVALRRLVVETADAYAHDPSVTPSAHDLTPREREIHDAVQAGRSTRQIADALSLSEVTVRWHAGRANKKVQSRIPDRGPAAVPSARMSPASTSANIGRPALSSAASGKGLGRAELRVALLVAEGLSNRQIAEQLFISRHTVESHLKQTFSKLGVRSRVELTRVILASSTETA